MGRRRRATPGIEAIADLTKAVLPGALEAGSVTYVELISQLAGARTLGYPRMERLMDHVLSGLQTSLRAQPDGALDRGMHFPVGWDPYFRDYMTLRDLYHYPTQHYDHHRQQLTLAGVQG